jgi:hypothetical protein
METLSPNEDLREWVDNAIQEADALAYQSFCRILELIREEEE